MADSGKEKKKTDVKRAKSSPAGGVTGAQEGSDDKDTELSSLNLKYNVRSKSTLGSVLKDYGYQDEKKRKKKVSEKLKRQRAKPEYYEDDRDKERRHLKEQKCQQIWDDMDNLKDHYYSHYMDLLKERVKQQHVEIKKRSLELDQKLDEKKQKSAAQRVKHRLGKHELKTDKSFLKDIPLSRFHDILAKERKLEKDGKLKTVTDRELFWADELNIPIGRTEEDMRRGIHLKLATMYSYTDLQTASEDESDGSVERAPANRGHGLYEIEELSESRPSTRGAPGQPWAVTQQARHVHKQPLRKQKDIRRGSLTNKKSKEDIGLIFPKVEMPKLHCFSMSLAKPPPDPIEERRKAEMENRERHRRLFLHRLRKMYQLALSNTASANRILDKHDPDDLFLLMEGPDVRELTSSYQIDQPSPQHEGDGDAGFFITRGPPHQHWQGKKYTIVPIPEERESEVDTRQSDYTHHTISGVTARTVTPLSEPSSRKVSGSGDADPARSKSMPALKREQSLPLTLNELVDQNQDKLLEPKQLSSLWINYMKNEKPVSVK